MQATSAVPGVAGGNREDLRNDITVIDPQGTPYTTLVRKTSEASSVLVETLSNRLRQPRTAGTREGTAGGKGSNKAYRRGRFGCYAHRHQDTWGVSDVQQVISKRGGTAGVPSEADEDRSQTLKEFKRDIEAINTSDNDGQNGNGGDQDMKTRGAFKWLSPAGAGLTPDVPNDFRVLGGTTSGQAPDLNNALSCVFLHNQTTPQLFSEDDFNALGKNLQKVHGSKVSFQVFAGDNVVETIDHFRRLTNNSPAAGLGTMIPYTVPNFDNSTEVTMEVNVYSSSFWRCEVMGSQFLRLNETAGLGDPNAALVLFMDLWYLDFLDETKEVETYENAGGQGGTFRAMWVNMCKSPRGNGVIKQN